MKIKVTKNPETVLKALNITPYDIVIINYTLDMNEDSKTYQSNNNAHQYNAGYFRENIALNKAELRELIEKKWNLLDPIKDEIDAEYELFPIFEDIEITKIEIVEEI